MAANKRTERFGLLLSPEERLSLRRLSELEGISESDVLRRLLHLALRKRETEAIQPNLTARRSAPDHTME